MTNENKSQAKQAAGREAAKSPAKVREDEKKAAPQSPREAAKEAAGKNGDKAKEAPAKASERIAKDPPAAKSFSRARSRSPRNGKNEEGKINGTAAKETITSNEKQDPPSSSITTISAHCGLQGERDSMEDEHVAIDLSYESYEFLDLKATRTRPLKLYAIFDGHCGKECAQYAGKNLGPKVKEKLGKFNRKGAELTVQHVLCFALEDLDREFMETHTKSESGCTAVVCLVDTHEKVIYCANVGDSRAIIGRSNSHLALTRDQDGDNPTELRRVEGSGGTIDEEGYVNDTVNMTRSLGDRSGKFTMDENGFFSRNFAIVSSPEVRHIQITDTHQFLILACDGLFEPGVFTSPQLTTRARHLIHETVAEPRKKAHCELTANQLKSVCKTLCQEAITKGSCDNVSVLIVLLTQ